MHKKIVKPQGSRIFINNIDCFNGKYIVQHFYDKINVKPSEYYEIELQNCQPDNENNEPDFGRPIQRQLNATYSGYTLIGSLRNKNSDIKGVAFVVKKSSDSLSAFVKAIQGCRIVVFDISEDPVEIKEARCALGVMLEQAKNIKMNSRKNNKRKPLTFILVTPAMTWSNVKENDLKIVESDYYRRNKYPEKYASHVRLEYGVMLAGKKYPKLLRTFILTCGVTYGYEENLLREHFAYAWGNTDFLPIYRTGGKTIPLIHIKNLSTIIFNLAFKRQSSPRYIFATEKEPSTQAEIIRALASAMNVSVKHYGSVEEFIKEIKIKEIFMEYLTADLPLHPTYIECHMKIKWINDLPFKSNIDVVLSEYILANNLKPHKICVLGPPGSGRTNVSRHLSTIYNSVYLDVTDIINRFLHDLRMLIHEISEKLKTNGLMYTYREPTRSELIVFSLPLNYFVDMQYPIIFKLFKERQINSSGLLTLQHGLKYLQDEMIRNNGILSDTTVTHTGAAGFWHNKTSSQEDRQLKDVGMSYERFTEGLLKSSKIGMVRLRLNGADSIRFGYVIDGYPKTADQAAMLFANPNASIVNTFGPPMPQEINMAGDHGDNFETAVAPANPLSNIGPTTVILLDSSLESIMRRVATYGQCNKDNYRYSETGIAQRYNRFRERVRCAKMAVNYFEEHGFDIYNLNTDSDVTQNRSLLSAGVIKRFGPPTIFNLLKNLHESTGLYLKLAEKRAVAIKSIEEILEGVSDCTDFSDLLKHMQNEGGCEED